MQVKSPIFRSSGLLSSSEHCLRDNSSLSFTGGALVVLEVQELLSSRYHAHPISRLSEHWEYMKGTMRSALYPAPYVCDVFGTNISDGDIKVTTNTIFRSYTQHAPREDFE
jgi:hypothetical protein